MLLLLVIYVALIVALLAGAAFFPAFANAGVVLALVVVVVGGALLIYQQIRRGERGLYRLVSLYFRRLEQIHADFASRKSLDRQAAELAAFIHNDLGVPTVALFARKKPGFLLTESFGIKKESLRTFRLGSHDELIQSLESRRTVIALRKAYAAGSQDGSQATLPFEDALPVLAGGKCSHVVLLSGTKAYPPRFLRPFLLALADQVGNYRHLEELLGKHSQLTARLRRESETMQRELRKPAAKGAVDPKGMIAAQDRLLRIHNRDQLYTTLMELLEEHFIVDFAAVFLRNSENGDFEVKYHHRAPQQFLGGFALAATSRIFAELTDGARCIRLDGIRKPAGDDAAFAALRSAGAEVLALLTDVDGADGVLAISRSKRGFGDDELEALGSYLRLFNLVLENQSRFEKIEQMSYTDSMTGLYNYRYFYKRLQEEILRAKRFSRHLALVIFDIDEFKVFNDSYGHQSGDFLLEQLGALLAKSVRSIDIVSRYGGEEFCIIMPETSAEDCSYFMDRMRTIILNQPFKDRFSDECHRVTVSLGGAIYPNDAQRIDRLIYCADMALLQAKSAGRNKSFMFDEKLINIKSDSYGQEAID